ncbi:hypothetical protein B7463_g3217, partial [Scytalidium lignicola]
MHLRYCLSVLATASTIWPASIAAARASSGLRDAPCFEACQMTLRQVRFTDLDGAGANRRIQACQSRLALTSLYLCSSVYCSVGERTAGLDAQNSTCRETVGLSILPFDIIANYTEGDIAQLRRLSRDNYVAPIELAELAIPSEKFFDLAHDTLVSRITAVPSMLVQFAHEVMRHPGPGMFFFWSVVVVIGLLNRIIVALGHRSTPQRRGWRSLPLSEPEEDIDSIPDKKSTLSSRPYVWLKRFVTVPATFGYRNAQPFGCWPKVSTQIWRYLSDRTGIISFANFPLIWLFGMRNNALIWLTGWDFKTYSNFHRWVARVSTVQAVIHSVGYTVLVVDRGGWHNFANYWVEMWWTTGELVCTLSLSLLEKCNYTGLTEDASHVSIFKARYDGIAWICCIIWALDRTSRMWRTLAFNRIFWNTMAYAIYDPDANIVRLSIPSSTSLYRPKPGTFYYIHWLNDSRFWESHPFTVASVRDSDDYSQSLLQDRSQQLDLTEESSSLLPREGGDGTEVSRDRRSRGSAPEIRFLIRPYDSFTRRLREAASRTDQKPVRFRVLVEGPYGHTLPFHRFDNIVFIVGGTGIVVPLSYLDVLCKSTSKTKAVRIIWVVREAAFAAFVLLQDFGGLLENNNLSVDVYITGDEVVASRLGQEIKDVRVLHGRPHIHGEVEDAIRDFPDQGSLAVVACGPAKMADDARRAVKFTMVAPTNAVPDSTDLGTLRPNFEPVVEVGETFTPLICPEFNHKINLPPNIKPNDPLGIFTLFFSRPVVKELVENTNKSYQEALGKGTVKESYPKWAPLTVEELYLYLGIRVYMSLTVLKQLKYYWNTDPEKHCGLHYAITSRMSRRRFEAITRWFRVAPTTSKSTVFERLEPLNGHIQSMSRQLWIPGRDLAVDECMVRFQGRSYDTLKIPSKPIPEGKGPHFDHGHQPPRKMGLNPTAAVVPYLVQKVQRPPDPCVEYQHILWLDNLFMSVKLAKYLERLKIGCTGTARTNSGIWSKLVQKKKDDKKHDTIPWGTVIEKPTVDGKVNMMAWKDNALVLMLTSTSTSAKTALKVFGNQPQKELPIPIAIDLYNHHMNSVDLGDQLRACNSGARVIRRGGWQALFHFLFHTVLVNSWLLSKHGGGGFKGPEAFREALYKALFTVGSKSPGKGKRPISQLISEEIDGPATSSGHRLQNFVKS